ncbi:MAG: methionine ABC transporter ATP-binding protein [Romboutsia timonensis]|uniref:methionine ABC transporter ATP-binding protein n=1 Tax=Romboutsia timonensis TaxID=1776391 RepID=UPI002A7586A9|nr:methionine ABC transporter ATP-binding protein [Romboutsia timonensis]MDY2881392.1 methionine ABC transporter ATP-binding protein [Romboutsia timonensis]
MIRIKGVNKYFGNTQVLKNINVEINKGEIFGLVGHSGAGKSTLLRCINGLESYDDGSITVNNKEIKDLTSKELREFRKDLGMIFQHFSLLERLNVYENVALPLECWGYSKEEINKKVDELLRLVGLENKAKNKPKHLSGGQKQRVAIARALALNPNILLCDEATSALDPNTTKSILSLLRDINKKLGITIIIVTHQMEVVKEVCNKVAILKDGKVLECGDTEELFLNHSECLKELLGEEEVVPNSGVNIKLFFPKEFSNGYIITSMARSLDIDFSIVWGKLEKFRDDVLGSLIINIPQDKKEQVINYLNSTDVKWEVLENKENKINNKELERA